MAIECWIWGNVNSPIPQIQEYNIRLCSDGFMPYRDKLFALSQRLVSATMRSENMASHLCWFAGPLGKSNDSIYVIALGTEQNSLLGTRFRGTRGLFCTLALGFTGEDFCLYRQEIGLFQPLMEILRTINNKCTGDDTSLPVDSLNELNRWIEFPSSKVLQSHCKIFRMNHPDDVGTTEWKEQRKQWNIFSDNVITNKMLWSQSVTCPTALGLLSEEDGEQLLSMFPGGVVTVLNGRQRNYVGKKKSVIQLAMEREEKKRTFTANEKNKVSERGCIEKPKENTCSIPKIFIMKIIKFLRSSDKLDDNINRAMVLCYNLEDETQRKSIKGYVDNLLKNYKVGKVELYKKILFYYCAMGFSINEKNIENILNNIEKKISDKK